MTRTGMTYRRSPGSVSMHPGVRLVKNAATVTWGQDADRSTSGSFSRLTGAFILGCPFILTQILWDVRISGTWVVTFVNGGAASPTVLYTVSASKAVTGGSPAVENTISLSPEILLLPGRHYLSAYDSATPKWTDKDTQPGWIDARMVFLKTWYDGTEYSYTLPVKLVGYPVDLYGLNSYMPPVAI